MAMFENISEFFKRLMQTDKKELLAENPVSQSKETAKDRLHIVLMQDRANVSADFLELMKQEIIEVIKKYIVVDESKIDVRLTNEENDDGSIGVPLLHANIPILNIRNDLKGEYMHENNFSSERIEGQEEIDFDNDKTQIIETIEMSSVYEKDEILENDNDKDEILENDNDKDKILKNDNEINENSESFEDENKLEKTEQKGIECPENDKNSEIEVEEVIENKDNDSKVEKVTETNSENIEVETEKIKENKEDDNAKENELEDEEEDDDDVTFDDLLKAAEEEEERLKKQSEDKSKKPEKKTKKTSSGKRKTSKKK